MAERVDPRTDEEKLSPEDRAAIRNAIRREGDRPILGPLQLKQELERQGWTVEEMRAVGVQ